MSSEYSSSKTTEGTNSERRESEPAILIVDTNK